MPPGALGGASPHPGGPSEHHSALIWPLGWFNTPGGTHSIARAEPSLRQLLVVEPLQMQFAPRSGPIQRLWFCPIRKYIRWTSRISKGMPIFEILTPNGHIEPQGTIRAAASYSRCSTAIISVGIVMYTSSPSYRMKHNTWALLYFKGSS